jgi:hypothetical protein
MRKPKPKLYLPRAAKPAFELCELIARMVAAVGKWEVKEKEMSKQLIDLHDYAKERKNLAKRNNTVSEADGIAIKFLLSVPGHSAGDTCTMAAAQARVYLAKGQAELYIYPA